MNDDVSLFKPGDVLLLTCLVMTVIILLVLLRPSPHAPVSSVIIIDQTGRPRDEKLPTKGSSIVQVEGPLGATIVELKPRGVRILSSPCPHKTCIGMGLVRHPGTPLACLPNRVLVRLDGIDLTSSVDAVTR